MRAGFPKILSHHIGKIAPNQSPDRRGGGGLIAIPIVVSP